MFAQNLNRPVGNGFNVFEIFVWSETVWHINSNLGNKTLFLFVFASTQSRITFTRGVAMQTAFMTSQTRMSDTEVRFCQNALTAFWEGCQP